MHVCEYILKGRLSFYQSAFVTEILVFVCLLRWLSCCISAKQAACKRVFMSTGRLCEVLVLACFEVAAFGCVSVSSIANACAGVLLD